jgi:hypothetical protein
MNVVNINKKHLGYNNDFYYINIPLINSKFKVEDNLVDYLETIHGDSCLIAYYIVYLIVSGNNLEPNINTPKNGLAFNSKIDSNKSNDITIGIYHAHLPDENVLIWYVVRDEYNELILKVKCIKHPESYDTILRGIMKTTDGYDTIRKQYFKDYLKDTYLKENKYILMFKDFFNFK